MNYNRKINNIGALAAVIIFIAIKYLPAQIRNLLPLFFALIGIAIAIYFYKKTDRRYEFKLFLILSGFMFLLFMAYIEHKVSNTSYLLNLYGFLSISAMLIVLFRVIIKSYNNRDIINLLVSLLLTIAIILILIAVISVKIFRIQL